VNAQGQKIAWKRPQLTVLVRIDLAESVLGGCKLSTQSSGADGSFWRCYASGTLCSSVCSAQRVT
jgi:hypothetical protein